ncbi:MAG: hypothetical protein ABIG88_02560 [Patescibacteria group bacterium]|nr:hypothetical protein [Patescibacteria group bacterium]
MGAYFKCYKKGNVIKKTLIKKKNGSLYPTINDFNGKIYLIKKYLENFIVDTKVNYDGKYIRVEQPLIIGKDIFKFLKDEKRKPKRFNQFSQKLNNLYLKTGILPDLVNNENILVTKDDEIKIIDIWPLFFKKRIEDGDVSEQSYKENLKKFNFLKNI